MSGRAVLIGMNNPHSSDPRHALAPYPQGVAGHRLWSMLSELRPDVTRSTYMRAFDRRNILTGSVWNAALAAAEAERSGLWASLAGRTVVLLGREVPRALHLPRTEPLVWQSGSGDLFGSPGPERWTMVPHPSGLNLWYNDPIHRMAVGSLLEELMLGCQESAPVP